MPDERMVSGTGLGALRAQLVAWGEWTAQVTGINGVDDGDEDTISLPRSGL